MKMSLYRLELAEMYQLKEISTLEDTGELDSRRAREARRAAWRNVGYDVYLGFVVGAPGERQAREAASAKVRWLHSSDAGELPSAVAMAVEDECKRWLDPKRTTCELVGEAAPAVGESIILSSFRHG